MLIGSKEKTMKGSKVLFETLKSLGVDTVFGYPGGIVLDVYDEFYNQSDIKHVLVRHEQSAVHAAEGYYRATGKCGVVLVTSGPGATNTITGIANAYLDGSPILVLSGQVLKNLLGKDSFQEANICDMTRTCTKATYQITSASDIQSILSEAMSIAMSGKKGPVVVDIVKDVFSESAKSINDFTLAEIQGPRVLESSIGAVFDRICNATKPVIVCGGGVIQSKAEDKLLEFANKTSIPVVDTMMGLGAYSQDNQNYLGMIGIFGDKSANQLLIDSDLIISLGARFNDRITCMFKEVNLSKKFIQIDINPNEISRNIVASDYIIGDIKEVLNRLNSRLITTPIKFDNWSNEACLLKQMNIKRTKTSNMLHSFEVIQKIDEYTKNKNVLFTSEVGQHQLWAVQNLTLNNKRRIFVSGGSGTMGFGFPAAIGASIGRPETSIVCIAGDGSFQMGIHELATCVENNLDVKIMILNNGYLGMVRQLQQKMCNGRYSETKISNPDFLMLAKSYDIEACRVTSIDEIDLALNKAFEAKGPFLIDFVIEPVEVL
ncbi:MAG: biosynthetic-type acetolactate synthase large subunit [Cyanobacteria bacterium SIG26]|nr:biosynthetic-type acetolactate synthase large subunit [Cyanobacteria bacterium SIG26]